MAINLTDKEKDDARRAFHLAMQVLDQSSNKADRDLANRIERLSKKFEK